MEITWLGHSCFRLKGRDATVVTDPFGPDLGYPLGKTTAQVVTVSHPHPQHSAVATISGQPRVVERPGEYEIGGITIAGIRTYHDAQKGQIRGKNTVFVTEIDGVRVCHLGDLGHVLSPEHTEEISDVDVLLVPVGGVSTIDGATAAEVVALLEPRLVVPMHYRTEVLSAQNLQLQPVDRFLKEMGVTAIEPQVKLSLTRGNIPPETRVALLDYRR